MAAKTKPKKKKKKKKKVVQIEFSARFVHTESSGVFRITRITEKKVHWRSYFGNQSISHKQFNTWIKENKILLIKENKIQVTDTPG